jgi:RND family efflux transporter MFP subunit
MRKAAKINGIIIVVLGLIVAASIYWVKHPHTHKTDANLPILVELGTPQEISIPNTISSTGNLEAIQSTNLSAKVAGYVTKINYKEGSLAKKGDLLIQLDDRKELAAVDSAKAQDNISALKYNQSIKMYHRRMVAYDDYIGAKTTHQEDNAALETAKTNLADKSILAPFSGITGAKQISIGDYIQPGTTLLTLTNLNKLRVTYTVLATDLNTLKLGQAVTLSSPAISGQHFYGHVSYIAPTIDTNSQTITVHAEIDNKQHKLKPGLFVTIEQVLGSPTQATVIPTSTLFASLKGYYVFGIKKNKAYKIPVTIGHKLQGHIVVLSGLTLNDQFITQGQTKIQVGTVVKVK